MNRKSPFRRHRVFCGMAVALLGAFWIAGRAAAQTVPEPSASVSSAAQSSSEQQPAEAGAEAAEPGLKETIFAWINFLLIAWGIRYLVKKYAAPALESRSRAIREDMQRSAEAMQEATGRLSAVEQKLDRLGEEISGLRRSAMQEAAAEQARIEELARADAGKVVRAAEQEIAAAAKAARQELKVYAAELAVGMAEERLQRSISPQSEARLFRTFVRDLTDSRDGGGSGRRERGN